jgi:predicted acylesterase/phospholipase RssA
MEIKTLCIGGGGYVAFAYYGCMNFLKANGVLDKCETYIGTSAGSILAFAFSFDTDCFTYILDNASQVYNEDDLDILEFSETWGLCNRIKMHDMFKTILKSKFNKESVTMKELYDYTKKHLYIGVTNLSKQRIEYINHIDNPDIEIWDAIEASTSVPLLMTKKVINGDVYCDGCLGEDVALKCIKTPVENTLVIYHNKTDNEELKITNFVTYITSMVKFFINSNFQDFTQYNHIIIDSSTIPFVSFDCDFISQNQSDYIEIGRKAAEKWFNDNKESI